MDNQEKNTQAQAGSGRSYAIDELLALMEPQYREDQETIRQCIAGLTDCAARLAARGQEEQFPRLRELCIEMAEFWGLAEDDTVSGYEKMRETYTEAFDQAVAAAKASGHGPELTEQAREEILAGLELYADEMRLNGPDLEEWAAECEVLAEMLEEQWQMDAALQQQTGLSMEGM